MALLLLHSGCELINPPEQIPSFIAIDSIKLEPNPDVLAGSLSSYITDAWIYVDDQLIGAFELPCTVPVLLEEEQKSEQKITVLAGIYLNGVKSTRVYYPFYTPWEQTISLVPDSIITLSPMVKYDSQVKLPLHETFELGGVLFEEGISSVATLTKTDAAHEVFEGAYSGKVVLNSTDSIYVGVSVNHIQLPTAGGNVFLELDYKTDAAVMFGLYAHKTGQVVQLEVAGVLPQPNWNKIYINLTPTVFRHNDANSFKLFMGAVLPEGESEAVILLDNIKLIHF